MARKKKNTVQEETVAPEAVQTEEIPAEEQPTEEVAEEQTESVDTEAQEAEEKAKAEAEEAARKEAEEKAAAEEAARKEAAAKRAKEEAAAAKAKVNAAESTGKMGNDQIKSTLVNEKMHGREKLETIAKGAMTKFAIIASKMLGYNETMHKNPALTPEKGVAKQYDLLNTIKSVANTEDYNDFKIKFDIINTAFRDLKDEAFADRYLYRYEQEWKWGKKDLTTLQHILLLLIDLSDGRTRAQNIKRIDLDTALAKSEVTLSDKAIENIKKYYS